MDWEYQKANFENQLLELESLQSMFFNPGEIKIEDTNSVIDIKEYINQKSNFLPKPLGLTINLEVDNYKFEIMINLPLEYPNKRPNIFVRNSKLAREAHSKLNKDLSDHMNNLEIGEPCIFSAICWIQDNGLKYIDLKENITKAAENHAEPLLRFWIYSHHIYSKTKRREIMQQANTLKLTGFCMPGKPGVICVEGKTSNVNEWWQIIRSMTWKRIVCKVIEECLDESESDFLKFNTFEEVAFQTSSVKCNHMDMGELGKYLEKHNCSYIFKDLFGVEVKSGNN